MKRAWSDIEEKALRRLWPQATWAAMRAALPGRSVRSIKQKASRMELRRVFFLGPLVDRRHGLGSDLTQARVMRRMSQRRLAAIAGLGVGQVCRTERTGDHMSLPLLRAWCDSLGLELRAVPVMEAAE